MSGEIVKLGDWISEGWNLFTARWQVWVLASTICFAPIVIILPLFFISFALMAGQSPAATLFIGFLTMVVGIAFPLFIIFVIGGMHRMAIKQIRGESISVQDIFSCKDCFGKLIILALLMYIANIVGLLMLFVGIFFVHGVLFFVFPLVVDKDLSPMEAINQSMELAKKDWLMFTLFAFIVGLISQVGIYFCYIGFVASFPLQFTITAAAYRSCFMSATPMPSAYAQVGASTPYIYVSPETQRQVDNANMATCPRCEARMPKTAKFCPKCGSTR